MHASSFSEGAKEIKTRETFGKDWDGWRKNEMLPTRNKIMSLRPRLCDGDSHFLNSIGKSRAMNFFFKGHDEILR